MALQYQIPQTSRFLQTATIFSAPFAAGTYIFNTAGTVIIEARPKTVYFFDRLNVGGTISAENYLDSISIVPAARLRMSRGNTQIHPLPIPIVNYIDNQELNLFVFSDKGNDQILIDFSGTLNQIPATVGIPAISIFLSFNIYAIDNNDFQANFRNDSGRTSGEKYRNL